MSKFTNDNILDLLDNLEAPSIEACSRGFKLKNNGKAPETNQV